MNIADNLVLNYRVKNDPLRRLEDHNVSVAVLVSGLRKVPGLAPVIPPDAELKAMRLAPPPGRIITLPAAPADPHGIATVGTLLQPPWLWR